MEKEKNKKYKPHTSEAKGVSGGDQPTKDEQLKALEIILTHKYYEYTTLKKVYEELKNKKD